MAAGAAGGLDIGVSGELIGLLAGGSLATASHATKAGTRVLINTSPEPVTNWTASVAEDVAVIGGLWTALHYPWLFVALLIVFMLLVAWLLPRIWRALKRAARAFRRWLAKKPDANRHEIDQLKVVEGRKDVVKDLYSNAVNKDPSP